jgi:hypothetical protein
VTCYRGFSVVTPQLAAPGRTTAVLVTLHGPDASRATNVTLRLVSDRVEEVTQLLAEVSQEIRGKNLFGSERTKMDSTSYFRNHNE